MFESVNFLLEVEIWSRNGKNERRAALPLRSAAHLLWIEASFPL